MNNCFFLLAHDEVFDAVDKSHVIAISRNVNFCVLIDILVKVDRHHMIMIRSFFSEQFFIVEIENTDLVYFFLLTGDNANIFGLFMNIIGFIVIFSERSESKMIYFVKYLCFQV